MTTAYETVIGLEVHVELLTETKLFCGCPNRFGGAPNTHVCPVCLGLPGTLPVVNRAAVEQLLRAALAVGCEVPARSKFDRKNYFYPDMPKNYQISQYDQPLASRGALEVVAEGASAPTTVGITRIHLEEDTGKSTHGGGSGRIESSEYTLEDYNRAGVPLAEIVSEPDMRSAQEAVAYLERLREILRWVGVSDCKMEEGSLRCDANVSVRPRGSQTLGTKTEIKNMNSFRSVLRAIEYESARQVAALERGERITQETRAWDEENGLTHPLRSKEEAHDYRYFPEPDIPPMQVDSAWLDALREGLPELPQARRERYAEQHGLSAYDAAGLTRSRALGDFFEQMLAVGSPPKEAANWLMGDVSRLLNANAQQIEESRLTPGALHEMIALIEQGTISKKLAKDVLEEMFGTGASPADIVKARGLQQIGSADDLRPIVEKVLDEQASTVADYLGGRDKAFGFLVGQVMAATRGKASPQVANALLRQVLEEKRAAAQSGG
ncbi:MAG: Asp-tRNA(Asn)/Glu-tRNA(Gln) amidotransferase subunit GatB [Proteobacteria bacterium]|nr:Asp-tRNA(Asn)/Glu-tRNA(Gln) amidotransferase subunit GatB [Pseudomonadota bacterium]